MLGYHHIISNRSLACHPVSEKALDIRSLHFDIFASVQFISATSLTTPCSLQPSSLICTGLQDIFLQAFWSPLLPLGSQRAKAALGLHCPSLEDCYQVVEQKESAFTLSHFWFVTWYMLHDVSDYIGPYCFIHCTVAQALAIDLVHKITF